MLAIDLATFGGQQVDRNRIATECINGNDIKLLMLTVLSFTIHDNACIANFDSRLGSRALQISKKAAGQIADSWVNFVELEIVVLCAIRGNRTSP